MKPAPFMLITPTVVASSFALAQSPRAPSQDNVLTYHGAPDRSGNYKVPGLTWERAKSVHLDEAPQGEPSSPVRPPIAIVRLRLLPSSTETNLACSGHTPTAQIANQEMVPCASFRNSFGKSFENGLEIVS